MSQADKRNIRDEIVERRRARIRAEGYGLGVAVPETRAAPLAAFARAPLVICEIKRRSPSRGAIAPGLDPVAQARLYRDAGVRSVSVLTEEDHFGGSLADLMAVKAAFPDLAVLRKDFLVDEEDVRVAHRAGADAVLLIASMLSGAELAAMHALALSLGMAALVEVHDAAEIDKIRPIRPPLVGINCRDLETFRLDRLAPVGLRTLVDWPAAVVFESGIFGYEDARYTREHGFAGILVGEAVVRKPELIADLIRGVAADGEGASDSPGQWRQPRFWGRIAARRMENAARTPGRPLVKVCGLTRAEDADAACRLGADLLGFVFAPSPRRADPALLAELGELTVPKVAVVVDEVPAEVAALLDAGLLDAVQFSGSETPERLAVCAWPYYKALRPRTVDDLADWERWRSPRLLFDAWSAQAHGGTGKRLDPEIVRAAAAKTALWLAGGIGPDNVAELVRAHRPELVDAASGLEAEPGKKDPAKLRRFFDELSRI